MKITALLTSLALAAFASFCLSLLLGTGSLELFAASATLFTLAGMTADYGRTPRILVPVEEPAKRNHRLPLAA